MVDLRFVKNYFTIFAIIYIIVLFTKIVFSLYLSSKFIELSFLQKMYGIFWGYRFDFAISGLTAFIVNLFGFNKRLSINICLLFIIVIIGVQIADIMYFQESSRHIGYEINNAIYNGYSLLLTAFSQHSYLMISLLALVIPIRYIFKYLNKKLMPVKLSWWWPLQIFILLLLTIFFIRGTAIKGHPLNPWQSNQIGNTKLSNISLSAIYNVTYSLSQNKIKPIPLPDFDENITNTLHKLYQENEKTTTIRFNRPNVVMFFLESWSGVHMNSYGFNKKTTPFFDEILKKSIRPKAMIAGGHRTPEGLFTTIASFQNPLGETVSKTQLQNYQYDSLVDAFNNDNYYTAFYQGSYKEVAGVGSLAQKLGFKQSFGKTDIKHKVYSNNSWGVQDPDLYTFVEKNIMHTEKPFFIGINGTTTHDDQIPETIKKIQFSNDYAFNQKLNALHFSDEVLGQFVKTIQKKYPNTLFVFLADHVGSINGDSFENYLIPFAIYHKDIQPKYYDFFISQRDVAPTILDMVYGNYRKLMKGASGKSLVSDNKFFADYYHSGILGWIEDNLLIEYNISLDKKSCYTIINFKKELAKCSPEYNNLLNNLISFTRYSQQLLFNGKTKKFTNNM